MNDWGYIHLSEPGYYYTPAPAFRYNPDEEYREAERRGVAGDVEQQAKALNLRIRGGDLERWRVGTAAQLGHHASALLLGSYPKLLIQHPIKYWWTKLTFLIPDSHALLRFEIRFRSIIAALRAVLPYWDDPPGTLLQYTEEVLTFFERAFLEDFYEVPGDYSEDFGVDSGVIREVYVGHANAAESSNFTRRFASAMIHALTAYHVFSRQPDDQTILPTAHPNALLERALQQLDIIFPIGVGTSVQKSTKKELIPWILLEYDPVLERSRPPGWTEYEIRG